MHRIDAAYCYACRTFRGLSVSVCVGTPASFAKRLNRSRYRLGGRLVRAKGTGPMDHVLDTSAHWRHLANTIE